MSGRAIRVFEVGMTQGERCEITINEVLYILETGNMLVLARDADEIRAAVPGALAVCELTEAMCHPQCHFPMVVIPGEAVGAGDNA